MTYCELLFILLLVSIEIILLSKRASFAVIEFLGLDIKIPIVFAVLFFAKLTLMFFPSLWIWIKGTLERRNDQTGFIDVEIGFGELENNSISAHSDSDDESSLYLRNNRLLKQKYIIANNDEDQYPTVERLLGPLNHASWEEDPYDFKRQEACLSYGIKHFDADIKEGSKNADTTSGSAEVGESVVENYRSEKSTYEQNPLSLSGVNEYCDKKSEKRKETYHYQKTRVLQESKKEPTHNFLDDINELAKHSAHILFSSSEVSDKNLYYAQNTVEREENEAFSKSETDKADLLEEELQELLVKSEKSEKLKEFKEKILHYLQTEEPDYFNNEKAKIMQSSNESDEDFLEDSALMNLLIKIKSRPELLICLTSKSEEEEVTEVSNTAQQANTEKNTLKPDRKRTEMKAEENHGNSETEENKSANEDSEMKEESEAGERPDVQLINSGSLDPKKSSRKESRGCLEQNRASKEFPNNKVPYSEEKFLSRICKMSMEIHSRIFMASEKDSHLGRLKSSSKIYPEGK